MRPIETKASNFNYGAPAGVADCTPMPCERTADGRTVSVWEPNPDERRAIANGMNIELHVWMQPPPMVGLGTTPAQELPASERKCLQPGPAGVAVEGERSPDAYPAGWPRCPGCGRPALDGHITCGNVNCSERARRA